MWRRARPGRNFLIVVLGAVAILIALTLFNAVRIDALGLMRGAAAVVDRTESMSRAAIPEYQDLALARLPQSAINGEYFRFDDNFHAARVGNGLPDAAGASHGSASKPPAAVEDEYLFALEFDDRAAGLEPAEGRISLESGNGTLVATHADGDHLATAASLRLPLAEVSQVVLRAKADAGNRFMLMWAAEGREAALTDNRLSLDLIADGEFHTYVVDVRNAFRRGVESGENVSVLAIAPSNVDGARVEIDFLRVIAKRREYLAQGAGTTEEAVAGELRPALFATTGRRIEYEVAVPAAAPRLAFGIATLLPEPGVGASITVAGASVEDRRGDIQAAPDQSDGSEIFASDDAGSDAWRDVELDLSRWAGQTVSIAFEAQSTGENVVFWSNPILSGAPERRFNVILVLEDTLRADHLSTLGYARETSPEKTRLMSEGGVIFTNAHSQATKTRPSIAALMTSLYPTATGVWDFSDRLSDRYLTLAEILRAQGFTTASFIQNGNAGAYAGAHQGFGTLIDGGTLGTSTEDLFGEPTLEWLEDHRDRNVFLYVHAIDPHGVYDPPGAFDRWYREAPADSLVGDAPLRYASSLDPDWAETPSAEARRRLYDGEIRHNDEVIGRFVRDLEQRGLLEDTLLIFVSDHGEWLGESGLWEHHPPGNRPVIHVPMMLRYAGVFDEPTRVDEAVQLIDVMPTVLELADVDTSGLLLHGDSLVPLIEGRDRARWTSRVTISEEPMAMDRNDPCLCGSLFFDQWQLHGSTESWPRRIESDFVKSMVYRFREDGITPVGSFLPDLLTRTLRTRTLSRVQAANIALWQRLTEGEAGDVYRMDPATLEELRGLGYVN